MNSTWIDIMASTQYENKWYLQAYIFVGHFTGYKTGRHHESCFVLMKHPTESQRVSITKELLCPL